MTFILSFDSVKVGKPENPKIPYGIFNWKNGVIGGIEAVFLGAILFFPYGIFSLFFGGILRLKKKRIMDKKTTIYRPDDIEKKNEDSSKKAFKMTENGDNLAKLIAEIVVENLIRKYRVADSKLPLKEASEVPERLKQKL